MDLQNTTIGIVVARFNDNITTKLLHATQQTLIEKGVPKENITTTWVPGAFEIPLIAQKMAQAGKYQAIVSLGAIIRGETPHFDFVAQQAGNGIMQVALKTNIPVIFGILTTDSVEQAQKRVSRGKDYALGALEMIKILESM